MFKGQSDVIWCISHFDSLVSQKWLVVEENLGLGAKYFMYAWYVWQLSVQDHSEVILVLFRF